VQERKKKKYTNLEVTVDWSRSFSGFAGQTVTLVGFNQVVTSLINISDSLFAHCREASLLNLFFPCALTRGLLLPLGSKGALSNITLGRDPGCHTMPFGESILLCLSNS